LRILFSFQTDIFVLRRNLLSFVFH